jgi:hypothetical protein
MKNKTKEIRSVLVILHNRFTPLKAGKYVAIECSLKGDILKETTLKKEPQEPAFDEVWVNDEGKASVADCTRFKRIYRHKLEKPVA